MLALVSVDATPTAAAAVVAAAARLQTPIHLAKRLFLYLQAL